MPFSYKLQKVLYDFYGNWLNLCHKTHALPFLTRLQIATVEIQLANLQFGQEKALERERERERERNAGARSFPKAQAKCNAKLCSRRHISNVALLNRNVPKIQNASEKCLGDQNASIKLDFPQVQAYQITFMDAEMCIEI